MLTFSNNVRSYNSASSLRFLHCAEVGSNPCVHTLTQKTPSQCWGPADILPKAKGHFVAAWRRNELMGKISGRNLPTCKAVEKRNMHYVVKWPLLFGCMLHSFSHLCGVNFILCGEQLCVLTNVLLSFLSFFRRGRALMEGLSRIGLGGANILPLISQWMALSLMIRPYCLAWAGLCGLIACLIRMADRLSSLLVSS